ncbi:ATP-dependent helicase, partial [Rhodococcus sp. 7Tela_A2]
MSRPDAAGTMEGMLHGLWSPGSGLMLWRDPAVDADDEALPSALRRWIDRPFRHRVELTLPGDAAPRVVPAVAVAPPDAAALLLDLPPPPPGGGGGPRAPPARG